MNLYRRLWGGVVCLLAVAGFGIAVMALPWGALLALSLFAAILGPLCGAGVYSQRRGRAAPFRHVLVAGACAVVGVIAVAGFVDFVGAVALLGVGLLVVGFPPVVRLLSLHAPRTPGAPRAPGTSKAAAQTAEAAQPQRPAQPILEPAPNFQRLDDSELCWRWRTSFAALQHTVSSADRLHLIVTRAALLDELARRDPQGFSRWLNEGARAASDPARYFCHARENPLRPHQQHRASDR